MSQNLRAFLAVIRAGEGTADPDGYRRLFGGELVSDLSDHPRKVVTAKLGGRYYSSSAAGAYQALARTWDDFVRSVGKRDFSPASQDEFAVWCIKRRRALTDIEEGRFEEAIRKCAKEWASLPGSPYGQPTMTMERARRIYLAAGGTIAGQDAAEPTPALASGLMPTGGTSMPAPLVAPIIIAAAQALFPLVADMFRSRSKSAGDIIDKAGPVLIDIARQVTQAGNAQEAVEKISQDSELAAAYRDAVRARYYDILTAYDPEAFAAGEQSRQSARAFAVQMTAPDRYRWQAAGFWALVAILSVGVVFGGGVMLREVLLHDGTDQQTRGIVIGAIVAVLTQVVSYFFGSSASSRSKDQTIERISAPQEANRPSN